MSVSVEDRRELVSLIWCLKPSDLSVLEAMLKSSDEAHAGFIKGDDRYIFRSKLIAFGLAAEIPPKSKMSEKLDAETLKNTSQEHLDLLNSMSTIILTPEGKNLLPQAMRIGLTTGWPPREGVISPDCIRMLEVYTANKNATSQNKLGVLYRDGKGVAQDFQQAIRHFRDASELGDRQAYNNLGMMYAFGWGVDKNLADAAVQFRKAADLGSVGGMDNLGTLYLNGHGVTQDYYEALKFFRLAADRGYANAQANMGKMYLNGWGVQQDNSHAYVWLSLAAAAGAATPKDEIAKRMTPQEISECETAIKNWKPVTS